MAVSWVLAPLLTLATLTASYVLHGSRPLDMTPQLGRLGRRATSDPADFSWVKRWAAIGDSFTSGVGSGKLYSQEAGDYKCARYDHSYAALVNNYLGPSVQKFQYTACAGDRSAQIHNQVSDLDGNLNLVMMTAGGNDLCLAGIILRCIFLPFQGEAKCQEILDKAQENIDTILKPNLKQILEALNDKMVTDSVVVYNGYAQYFNTANEACSSDQDWSFPKLPVVSGLKLTVSRRSKFNTLVKNINKAIQEVVEDVTENSDLKYTVGVADWDPWPRDGVSGQMCDPSSTGRYPDPSQGDLQFFKPDTFVSPQFHDELKKRDIGPEDERVMREMEERSSNIYGSLLWRSADPRAAARHRLDRRAPAPPNCPGDENFDFTFGLGVPDAFGKFFHPNELGHETITAFALETMIDLRAKVLGLDPSCAADDEFKCWQKDGRKGYANPDRLNKNYKKFCDDVDPPSNTKNWKREKTYHDGTPDGHTFLLQLSDDASRFDKDECLESFDRIINSCDGNDPDNPMNWKFGGRYVRGAYTYEVNIQRDNRPWPPIKTPTGECEGWYKVFFGEYKMRGAGWSGWDSGQKTLLPKIKGCLGLGVTKWKFEYFDEPDDGMEWKASFNTPIWVRSRCFKNNKVAFAAGGFTDGCKGND